MKDKWLFDNLDEMDILRNLPEELPEMEDEVTAKRIEKRVMQEMQKESAKQKKGSRKRLLAAAVCGLAVVGLLGHQPILAAFRKVFHDLPGVGVYINDKNQKIYEVQIDSPVQEKDGVRVELLDFYCEGEQIYGTVRLTGENLLDMSAEYTEKERDALLDETFPTTWYYGEKSKKFHSSGKTLEMDDACKLVRYEQKGSEWLYLDEGIDTYYLEVGGFARFTLKIAEPKTVESPEELGDAQTLNDTTITARAAVAGNQIELEYYIIPSDEVKLAFENQRNYYMAQMPYQFELENQTYVENAKGERLEPVKWKTLRSGYKLWYEGGEADFPLTFHRPTLTGTNMERVTAELMLPETGGEMTENLPKFAFQYGTVELLSLRKESGKYQDGNAEYPTAIVDVTYRVVPKEGLRQMYAVNLEAENVYGSEGFDTGEDCFVRAVRCYLKDAEQKTMQITMDKPFFWIVGEYEIVMEKPIS